MVVTGFVFDLFVHLFTTSFDVGCPLVVTSLVRSVSSLPFFGREVIGPDSRTSLVLSGEGERHTEVAGDDCFIR